MKNSQNSNEKVVSKQTFLWCLEPYHDEVVTLRETDHQQKRDYIIFIFLAKELKNSTEKKEKKPIKRIDYFKMVFFKELK